MPRPRPLAAATAVIGAALLLGCPNLGAPTPPVASDTPATFENVNKLVFSNCTTRSCHGDLGRGGLVLTADKAYDQLVNKPAEHTGAAGKLRVVPNDPDKSFLLTKLTGPGPDEGDLMPQRGAKLPDATIDLVRRWIAAGCPR